MSSGGTRLTLYGRSYCHLCDEMRAALVPVLAHADAELCHYHLDAPKVRAYLGLLTLGTGARRG